MSGKPSSSDWKQRRLLGRILKEFKMDTLQKQIDDFKQAHPDIAKAMEVFKMGMNEYQQAFRFLNEPQTYTSNSTNTARSIK